MGKLIILNFPPKVGKDEKNRLTLSVNNKLAEIQSEVNSWNGFVELQRRPDNDFIFIAKCDNEFILSKMQHLLDGIN